MCTCMLFLNSSDKAHGKKLRCHNFSPKDLQTEIVASSKSFKSALGEGEKKIKNGYTSNQVPVLEVKILYKTVVKYFYEALNSTKPLAALHRYHRSTEWLR